MRIDYALWSEIISLIVSILCYSSLKNTVLRYFPFFLLFIVAAELTGTYIGQVMHESNHTLYNFTYLIGFIFYTTLYYKIYKVPIHRKILVYISVLFILFYVLNIFFIQKIGIFNSYSVIVGSLVLIVYTCLYFLELIQQVKAEKTLTEPMFWISTGILISCLIGFFYWTFFELKIDRSGTLLRLLIKNAVLVRYLCFSIGFLCQKMYQR
jgi:hypothetical protein